MIANINQSLGWYVTPPGMAVLGLTLVTRIFIGIMVNNYAKKHQLEDWKKYTLKALCFVGNAGFIALFAKAFFGRFAVEAVAVPLLHSAYYGILAYKNHKPYNPSQFGPYVLH